MSKQLNTYANGYSLYATKDIYMNDLIQMCYILNNLFTERYGIECSFEPEPIGGGGIIWNNPPSFNGEYAYKSMRLGISGYPFVEGDTLEDIEKFFNNKDPVLIIKKGERKGTFLKAFYDACYWTIEELQLFQKAFEEIGIKKRGRMPSKKRLSTVKKIILR